MSQSTETFLRQLHQFSRWIGVVLLIPAVLIFVAQALWPFRLNTTLLLPYGLFFLICSVTFLAAPRIQLKFFEGKYPDRESENSMP